MTLSMPLKITGILLLLTLASVVIAWLAGLLSFGEFLWVTIRLGLVGAIVLGVVYGVTALMSAPSPADESDRKPDA